MSAKTREISWLVFENRFNFFSRSSGSGLVNKEQRYVWEQETLTNINVGIFKKSSC